MSWITLCDIRIFEDIEQHTYPQTFIVKGYLIVKSADKLFIYLNKCPHRAKALNTNSGPTLDEHANYIRCGHHNALFTISEGLCVSGPCAGESLVKISFKVSESIIYVAARK